MSTTEGAGGYGGDWGDSRVSGGESTGRSNGTSSTSNKRPITAVAVELPTDPARNEYGRIVDVLGNGRWKGLVLPDDDPLKALQSVYLDDTPVMNVDGSWNFRGVYLAMVYGSNTQAHIKGFDGVEAETVVGAEIKRAVPVTQRISDTAATACRVKVSVPALIDGENGSEVAFKIEVQDGAGTWTTKVHPWTTTDRGGWSGSATAGTVLTRLSMVLNATAKTLTRATGSFLTNGFAVGQKVQIVGAVQAGNKQVLEITAVTDLVVTFGNASGLVDETISGGLQTVADNGTIKGKFTSKYVKGYWINLQGTTGPWNIRVTKLTPDADGDVTKQRALYFESLTTITAVKQRYPNTVVAELVVDSRKIQRVPKRGYLCDTAIIKVPTNYDPETRTYATTGPGTTGGIWDGTFKEAYSDNPAWCFFDMLTNTIYGAGKHIDAAKIDTGALYQIAQYCDEMVNDGQGGTEPRFTCNCYITQPQEAIKLLSYMASIFRGAAYWAGGTVVATQDRPDSAAALFTSANVKDGKFTYSSTAKRARHTACIVWWNDPANGYARKSEYVEDADGIARYGYNVTEVTAFGCTSQGQARRLGLWTLAVELAETETVNFVTGLEGIPVRPGELIQVHDPKRFGLRHGGRVLSSTTSAVTVDSAFTFVADHAYTLACMLPDGTLESRSVTNAPGVSSVFAVSTAFSAVPAGQWILTDAGVSFPITYRVVGVTEQGGEYEITALIHNASKYAAAEEGLSVVPVTYPAQFYFEVPQDLTLTETIRRLGTRYVSDLVATWTPCANAIGYRAQARLGDGDWEEMTVSNASAALQDVTLGTYVVRVVALYPSGRVSPDAVTAAYSVLGTNGLGAPAAPTGLCTYVQGGNLYLSWTNLLDEFGAVAYEVRVGASWDTAMVVGKVGGSPIQIPQAGTYWVAALRFNKYSLPASLAVSDFPFQTNVIQTSNENPDWTGTKTDTSVLTGEGLTLRVVGRWVDIPRFDKVPSLSWFGGVAPSGTYETPASHEVDVGTAQVCRVTAAFTMGVDSLANAWNVIPNFSECPSVAGQLGGIARASLEIATAGNDGVYGSWQPFVPGDYFGRKFKQRMTISTDDTQVFPVVSAYSWSVDVPDRLDAFTGLSVGTGGVTQAFTPAFHAVPNVQVTIHNAQAGDTWVRDSISTSSITGHIVNGGSNVAGTIDLIAQGY